jgi:hypothetical protein
MFDPRLQSAIALRTVPEPPFQRLRDLELPRNALNRLSSSTSLDFADESIQECFRALSG